MRSDGVRATDEYALRGTRRASDSADLQRHLDPDGWRAEPIQRPNTDQLLAVVQILDSQD
jgi:hypothetical protein